MINIVRWINGTLLKPFRDRWWDSKTKVYGKVVDPYSYQLGFDAGVESTRPTNGIFVKLSDEELKSLEESWKTAVEKYPPSILIRYDNE